MGKHVRHDDAGGASAAKVRTSWPHGTGSLTAAQASALARAAVAVPAAAATTATSSTAVGGAIRNGMR